MIGKLEGGWTEIAPGFCVLQHWGEQQPERGNLRYVSTTGQQYRWANTQHRHKQAATGTDKHTAPAQTDSNMDGQRTASAQTDSNMDGQTQHSTNRHENIERQQTRSQHDLGSKGSPHAATTDRQQTSSNHSACSAPGVASGQNRQEASCHPYDSQSIVMWDSFVRGRPARSVGEPSRCEGELSPLVSPERVEKDAVVVRPRSLSMFSGSAAAPLGWAEEGERVKRRC